MTDVLTTVVTLLPAIGLGGVLGAYFQARLQRRTQIGQHEHDLKQKRYLCTLMLMLTKLNADVGMPKLQGIRPDLKNPDDLDNELEAELLNGFIFASDEVLESLAAFIRTSNHHTFSRTAGAMRKDLWGKRSKVSEDVLSVVSVFRSAENVEALNVEHKESVSSMSERPA